MDREVQAGMNSHPVHLFQGSLSDLGQQLGRPELEGIWVPTDLRQEDVGKYIHEAFRARADSYVKANQNIPYHEKLIKGACGKIGRSSNGSPFIVLDLCSGAGNSVIPMLTLFPESRVIASDLSIELLCILKRDLHARALLDRCTVVQLNAENPQLVDEGVDMVVGNAALHHLLEPQKTLQGAARVLKRNGQAVFFEPFEIGYSVLEMLWKRILADPRADADVAPDVGVWFGFLTQDFAMRRDPDKSQDSLQEMEDKWFFTRHFFESSYESWGFQKCLICPQDFDGHPLLERTGAYLRAWPYGKALSLPEWAWRILSRYEENFSIDARRELLFESTIILWK
jgi:ubiquinone/menaquinone biosynthesis C-methylase UbiE